MLVYDEFVVRICVNGGLGRFRIEEDEVLGRFSVMAEIWAA
jgi:hypothetical protein